MNGIDVLMAQGIEWRIMDRRVQGSNSGCNRTFTQREFCHSKQNTFWPEPTSPPDFHPRGLCFRGGKSHIASGEGFLSAVLRTTHWVYLEALSWFLGRRSSEGSGLRRDVLVAHFGLEPRMFLQLVPPFRPSPKVFPRLRVAILPPL